MKLNPNTLEFTDVGELVTFIDRYRFFNLLELDNQIIDRSGNVIVKYKTLLTEPILKKLLELEDTFEHNFKISLNGPLINALNELLSEQILRRLNVPSNAIQRHLLKNNDFPVDYKGIISNSFIDPAVTLTAFNYYMKDIDFFLHLSDMGLLTLGIAAQKTYQLKFLQRYAFLTGFFMDICYSDSNIWKYQNFSEADVNQLAAISASFADRINLPYEVVTAIEHPVHTVADDKPQVRVNTDNLQRNSFFENVIRKMPTQQDESSEQIINVIIESVKISKFLKEINNRILQETSSDVKILSIFSYNLEKGYFSKEIAGGIIKRFQEYEDTLNSIKQIAAVEKACPFQSAWAYPKPRSAQVLCQKKIEKCPLSIRGRDINIVNKLSPYGYIGTSLEKGYYPKCKLEEKLPKISV